MDFKDKAESLAQKMNSITQKLDLTEELLLEGDDIIEYVQEKTKNIQTVTESDPKYKDIMNLEIMTDDFKYIRETLKEVSDNARRVQSSITIDLLSEDSGSDRPSLITAFSELSKAITDAQKLYIQSYREMSTTLLNLDKMKKDDPEREVKGITIEAEKSVISTTDLLKKLREEK
jgi:hypothetical protein